MKAVDTELFCFMAKLQRTVENAQLPAIDEALVKEQLTSFLNEHGYRYDKEYRLSEQEVVDFLIHTGSKAVVLQIKLRARRTKILTQLSGFAQHAIVDGILLLTGTEMKLTPLIQNKPSLRVSLGQGWL